MISNVNLIMKAKFTTSCISCGEIIKPGKEIAQNNQGKWVHKYCTEDVSLP